MRRRSSQGLGERLAPYVLLAPFLFTLIVFFGYAFVRVSISASLITTFLPPPSGWV